MRIAKRKRCLSNENFGQTLNSLDNDLESSVSKKSKRNNQTTTKLNDISNYFDSKEKFVLDCDQINIVAAKKSSYFSLTPASSVTSLADLNEELLNEPIKKVLSIKVKKSRSTTTTTTTTKKRGRKNQTIKTYLKEKENTDSNRCNLQKCKLIETDEEQLPASKKTVTESDLLNDLNLFYKNYDQLKSKPIKLSQTPFPTMSWTDKFDFYTCMRSSEIKYKRNYSYLNFHKSIEAQMRAILIDWLIEICHAYRLHRETLHLAIEYFDRFMSQSKVEMRVDRLQLIGLTSLYLAAKNEEIYAPKLSDFSSHMESYSDDNEDLMKKFELAMLKTLEWKISPVTANTWLQTYLQLLSINYKNLVLGQDKVECCEGTGMVIPVNFFKNSDKNSHDLDDKIKDFYLKNYMKSITLIDLCLFDMESLKFDYSILAATALYYVLSKQTNRDLIVEKVTGLNMNELSECIKWMYVYYEVCKDLLYDQNLCQTKKFNSIDENDWHNIQLYYQYLDLLKEVQSRKTMSYEFNGMMTPPESNRKFSMNDHGESSDACSISSLIE